ncbi:YoaK family protein [Streptomyces sp. SID1121]|uniref:YoaK family protein n=1 Tax=Streptomyces sp. SID1121 TaxID=3425888 RepID=UPI0040577A33
MSVILRDAWSTLVPGRDVRHGPLPPLLVGLTVVTGLVDAFSYLVLGHVFVANMTGNVVFLAFAVLGASGFSVAASATALGAFLIGALAGGRLVHQVRRHRGKMLYGALGLEAVLVLASYLIAALVDSPSSGGARYVLIVLLGVAMGVQNAVARALTVPDLTTTVLTLTLTGMAADSRLAGGPGGKIGRRSLSAVALFLGALIGAATVLHSDDAVPLLIGGLLLALAFLAAFSLPRATAEWVGGR